MPTDPTHFLSVADWSRESLRSLVARATELKRERAAGRPIRSLEGKSVLLYFEKPSLRTHVSFEVGVAELGAHPVYLPPGQVRIEEREAVEDVARGLSRWCHAIVARTFSHQRLVDLARFGTIPVINALSDYLHPCQALADVQTIAENGDPTRDRVVYIGDGNNVAHSLMHAAGRLGMPLTVCTPEGYAPSADVVRLANEHARASGGEIRLETDPRSAVKDAAFVYTDVWASMGQEDEARERRAVFAPYQVNRELLSQAPAGVRLLHCLPAHRGEEVTAEVFEDETSLVFDQAENRLHAQKAILERLVGA